MNEEEIKRQTFKINSFDEFPFDKMYKVVNAITLLGYTAMFVDNGNIVFTEITRRDDKHENNTND